MKMKATFLQTIGFALPLALWTHLGAQTQGGGGPKPAAQTNEWEPVFNFPGGTPRQFMEAVEKHYKVDWLSIASIPSEMNRVEVPKLRFTPRGEAGGWMRQLVQLYNRLAERSLQLGTLVVEGGDTRPSVVMLVPNPAWEMEQPKVKVKAFTIWGLNDTLRTKLEQDIRQAVEDATEYAANRRGDSVAHRWLEGHVAIHLDTNLLVAVGSESYVDLVESISLAYRGAKVETLRLPTPLHPVGEAPGK